MEILVFTLNAIFVYFLSDWILRQIERRRGAVFKHRQLVFFVIICSMALVSFEFLNRLFGGI
jgi:hypothetical protein